MPSLQTSKDVFYMPEQMYALVNAVSDYSQFVPFCTRSVVLDETPHTIDATLFFAKHGFEQSCTTHNRLIPYRSIEIQLIDGPFHYLNGMWRFEPHDAMQYTKVSLDLQFEFSSKTLGILFKPFFERMVNQLVVAFLDRARTIYSP